MKEICRKQVEEVLNPHGWCVKDIYVHGFATQNGYCVECNRRKNISLNGKKKLK